MYEEFIQENNEEVWGLGTVVAEGERKGFILEIPWKKEYIWW